MKYISIFFFLGISILINAQPQTKYLVEDISISTRDNKKLSGTLSIPSSLEPISPIVIFVASPQPVDRNYHGIYSAIADSLARNGIASFRFDNRAYVDSISTKTNPDKFTMFDSVEDLHDIYTWLRKDKRFTHSPIGLLGHSEGGASCAIESSQNNDIAFLIVLSTMGLPGSEITFYQSTLPLSYLSGSLDSDQRNSIVRQIFTTLNIISEYADNDAIEMHLRKYLDDYYTSSPDQKKEFGKLTKERFIDTTLKGWMTPRKLCYIKYIPEQYYSKIKCPTLVICGMDDERIEWKTNLDGIERIFISNNKHNYKIVGIEGVNHAYEETKGEKIPGFVSVRKKDPSKREWGKGFQQLNSSIYRWINELEYPQNHSSPLK